MLESTCVVRDIPSRALLNRTSLLLNTNLALEYPKVSVSSEKFIATSKVSLFLVKYNLSKEGVDSETSVYVSFINSKYLTSLSKFLREVVNPISLFHT